MARPVSVIAGLCLVLYLLSYVLLSWNGAYEPAVVGLNGVKWYVWAPKEFVDRRIRYRIRWNAVASVLYYPLWSIDTRYWHTEERSYTDHFPKHDLTYVQE